MFAEVGTLLPAREHLLTLPRTSITFAPYGDVVFLTKEQDGRSVVERQQVSTGQTHHGRVEIVDALVPSDRVVMGRQAELRNGQTVSIDNAAVPPTGGRLEH
jgi:membrane fusion protein (multidrug efflux system)